MKPDWVTIAITAYVTVLVSVFVAQWQGVAATEGFVERYQTLLAGGLALVGFLIAFQQLREERNRHASTLIRSFDHEMAALDLATELADDAVNSSNTVGRTTPMALDAATLEWIKMATTPPVSSRLVHLNAAIKAHNLLAIEYALPPDGGELSELQKGSLGYRKANMVYQAQRVMVATRKRMDAIIALTN